MIKTICGADAAQFIKDHKGEDSIDVVRKLWRCVGLLPIGRGSLYKKASNELKPPSGLPAVEAKHTTCHIWIEADHVEDQYLVNDLHDSFQAHHWETALSVKAADGSQASIWTRDLSNEMKPAIAHLMATLS